MSPNVVNLFQKKETELLTNIAKWPIVAQASIAIYICEEQSSTFYL